MRKRDPAILNTYRLAMLLPSIEWPFKNQRTAHFCLREFATYANEPQDLRGYWTKVH